MTRKQAADKLSSQIEDIFQGKAQCKGFDLWDKDKCVGVVIFDGERYDEVIEALEPIFGDACRKWIS